MMKLHQLCKEEIARIRPREEEIQWIQEQTKKVKVLLNKEIHKEKLIASIFIGGSLAKDTFIKREGYDIDLFVRFDKKYQGRISDLLNRITQKTARILKGRLQRMHGSRDYFQISLNSLCFEIIPVLNIKKAKDAQNITDLSYFHVAYIRKKINEKKGLHNEIRLAKQFCYAQGCYGAESYIKGFSGYALELLVSYYNSFLGFIKAVASHEKIILDPERQYKSKQHILLDMNEAKLQSPIVFVDPIHKERNALAALSSETFLKFQEACRRLLRSPSKKFFIEQDIDPESLKREAEKNHAHLVIIQIKTNKQEGDIAGTKLLKFANFLAHEYEKFFVILKKEFQYNGKREGLLYLILRKKDLILVKGPPTASLQNFKKFKGRHPRAFVRNGIAYAEEKVPSPRDFFSRFRKKHTITSQDMGITGFSLMMN